MEINIRLEKEKDYFGIADAEGDNYPSFMAMELKTGYLKEVCGGGEIF